MIGNLIFLMLNFETSLTSVWSQLGSSLKSDRQWQSVVLFMFTMLLSKEAGGLQPLQVIEVLQPATAPFDPAGIHSSSLSGGTLSPVRGCQGLVTYTHPPRRSGPLRAQNVTWIWVGCVRIEQQCDLSFEFPREVEKMHESTENVIEINILLRYYPMNQFTFRLDDMTTPKDYSLLKYLILSNVPFNTVS